MECLENIVGLVKEICPCFTDDFNNEATVSESGVFIDQVPEFPIKLSVLKSATNACMTLQDMMIRSRAEAMQTFKEELVKRLQMRFTQAIKPFNGAVGGISWTKDLPISTAYAGVFIQPNKLIGAELKLKRIDTYFAQTANFDLVIYDSEGAQIQTIALASQANTSKQNTLVAPVILPAVDLYNDPYRYYFAYEAAGLTPKNNKITCGSCHGKEQEISKYVYRRGVTFNSFSSVSESMNGNGLSLYFEMRCQLDPVICDLYANDVYAHEIIPASIARKSVEYLIKKLLRSNAISFDTFINFERLEASAAYLHNKFKNDIAWMADNAQVSSNGCFSCTSTRTTNRVGPIMQ